MTSVGIKELKDRLSEYIAKVKQGEEVVVTERGRPVARIVQEGSVAQRARDMLAPLVRSGLVRPPQGRRVRRKHKAVKVSGKPASQMIIEDRR